MIRRLCAMAALAFVLAACGQPDPEPAPEPAPAPPAPPPSKLTYTPAKSPTLDAVRRRGYLICGVHPQLAGFSARDVRGVWRGFDVDICRAIAAATLGDATKVRFTPLSASERFTALRDGRIDVLSRNTSATFSRDAGLGLDFPVVSYFDGQGFLTRRSLALSSVEELSGARICVQAGTDAEGTLSDHFAPRGLTYTPVVEPTEEAARLAYESEACDALSADVSGLAAARSVLNNPAAHEILQGVISKEPLGPVVRSTDATWADIVRWTVHALVLAEELELRAADVEEARKIATAPEARRLLGVDGELGPLLGLSRDWAFQAIRQVGAYDEIFRRNLGEGSPLRLARGLNAQWSAARPGLLYAPPMR